MSYKICKLTDDRVVDFAATELKKYLRMMMPECGDIPIVYEPGAADGFRLGLAEDFGLTFDESWRANDGLVNTVSAKNPADEPAREFDGTAEKGVWNVMPVLQCDHGMATGLFASRKKTRNFYRELGDMLIKVEN